MVGALGFVLMSCGDDDNETITVIEPNDPFDARINNNSADSVNATVFLSDIDDGIIDVLLSVSSTEDMKRVYTTQNLLGQGEEKVDASDVFGVNDKGDGSIDLSSDLENGFEFSLDFSTAGLPVSGTLVYTFWTTTGKGDFRDITKRFAEGPFTLTIDLGGENPANQALKATSGIRLEAPTGDARSETFISTLDCEVYQIASGSTDEENLEFTQLWDFGYYFLNSTGASLASPSNYPSLFADPDGGSDLVNVFDFLGINSEEVNDAYFELAEAAVDYDAITNVSDLTSITTASSADPQVINNLEVGDVVFVVNQYGKNAIIRVTNIEPGFGSNDFIEFDIKVEL